MSGWGGDGGLIARLDGGEFVRGSKGVEIVLEEFDTVEAGLGDGAEFGEQRVARDVGADGVGEDGVGVGACIWGWEGHVGEVCRRRCRAEIMLVCVAVWQSKVGGG